jgi:serine/threonine-protein phosphatase 6 regulatory ankyrin repeat subunit B
MNDDPRRCLRLEREINTLLGEKYILNELEPKFNEIKKNMLKKIINTQDSNGDSILHISSFHGDFRIVNKLVFFGGNKKLKNSMNKIPVDLAKDNFVRKVLTNLNKAAKNSDEKNITELVNFGEDINKKKTIFSQAPIHKIIESKDKKKKYEVLKKMLDMGADPNIKDSNGWSALHYASQFGDLESVKILVENNAYIDTYSNNQRIPLHLASNRNYPEIVKYLLENKSNPNYKDDLGCTPIHLASKQGNTKCIEHLLNYGADLYSIDFRGWNILHYAAFHGHKKTVRFICKYDADFDILKDTRNSQNKLPIEIVRDPSVKPYFISLWHAAKEGNLDMTRNILNDGEDINEQTQFLKNTPLHLAVINNHYLEVRLLLEHNCNVELKNKDDISVFEYATLIYEFVERKYEEFEDKERGLIDLRDILRDILKKKDEILDAIICKSNWNVRIWTARDFAEKIFKALGLDKEKEKNEEKNEGEEGSGNNNPQGEQNNSVPN